MKAGEMHRGMMAKENSGQNDKENGQREWKTQEDVRLQKASTMATMEKAVPGIPLIFRGLQDPKNSGVPRAVESLESPEY